MDSRNLVTSIVTCYVPEANGRAEYPLFTRICGTFAIEREVRRKSEYLDPTQLSRYLDTGWRSFHALWAAADPITPALADADPNPTSWSTSGTTYEWHMSLNVIVVWSLHA